MFRRTPSLKKLSHEAFHLITEYKKHKSSFSREEQIQIEEQFKELDQSALQNDKERAATIVQRLTKLIEPRLPKNGLLKAILWILALCVALFIATIVRQMVFELYEIPSGSMRPTFREGDHLAVSKTTFGVNIPFTAKHLLFSPERVVRGGVITFTGEGLDIPDTETRYFWLFPGTKRYIKRMIGKPEDTLTFYGGLIYGVDKEGNPIEELLKPPFLTIDHVPFNNFEQKFSKSGPLARGGEGEIIYRYFNIPIGKLIIEQKGVRGEVFDGKKWIKDRPEAAKEPHEGIQTLSDWFGMGGFGQVRINRDRQLEIAHHPYLAPYDRGPGLPPLLGTLPSYRSYLPLDDELIHRLKSHLYTARFKVKGGVASQIGREDGGIPLSGIPDGTYEFYNGEPVEIHFAGVPRAVSQDHPFRHLSDEQFKTLFNLGIQFHPYFNEGGPFPSRFAYFRDGALYVMGAPLLDKGDPRLNAFIEKEKAKKGVPFLDSGPPSKEKILGTGLKIKEGHYLPLGDNYAMSSDGRDFGAIPAGNLEGSPSFIFWPPGDRMGATDSPTYPWWNPYTLVLWALFIGGIWAYLHYEKKRKSFPLFPKHLNK